MGPLGHPIGKSWGLLGLRRVPSSFLGGSFRSCTYARAMPCLQKSRRDTVAPLNMWRWKGSMTATVQFSVRSLTLVPDFKTGAGHSSHSTTRATSPEPGTVPAGGYGCSEGGPSEVSMDSSCRGEKERGRLQLLHAPAIKHLSIAKCSAISCASLGFCAVR